MSANFYELNEKRQKAIKRLEAFDARASREDNQRLLEAWKKVLATKEGREVLAYICDQGRVFSRVFDREMKEIDLAYYTGRREMATIIYTMAQRADAEAVLTMFNEHNVSEAAIAERRRPLVDDLNEATKEIEEEYSK